MEECKACFKAKMLIMSDMNMDVSVCDYAMAEHLKEWHCTCEDTDD